jgi:hypothetical protein
MKSCDLSSSLKVVKSFLVRLCSNVDISQDQVQRSMRGLQLYGAFQITDVLSAIVEYFLPNNTFNITQSVVALRSSKEKVVVVGVFCY